MKAVHIPGLDVAGTIAELGEGVSGPAVGEAVFGFLPMTDDGAAAEYSLAAANILAPAPASIPLAVLNLIRTDDAAMAALVGLIANGGVLVSTGSPAQEDAERKVRTISMYVRSDAAQLAGIARLIDAGTVKVGVAGRYPLAETAKVHELSAADRLRGKVVITVP